MIVPRAAVDAARKYERLVAGWSAEADSYAVYLTPATLDDPCEAVEIGFRTVSDAADAVHRIRAGKILAAARGLHEDGEGR